MRETNMIASLDNVQYDDRCTCNIPTIIMID